MGFLNWAMTKSQSSPRRIISGCDSQILEVLWLGRAYGTWNEIGFSLFQIPGGTIEDSKVLRGVMINKDIVHPKMKRRIEKPRIVLLDCNLEYKKGESQTNIEFTKEEDFM